MMRHFIKLLLLGCLTIPALAQIDRTEINGTVTDPSSGTLVGATVTVVQEGTNQTRVVKTDDHGQFVVSSQAHHKVWC